MLPHQLRIATHCATKRSHVPTSHAIRPHNWPAQRGTTPANTGAATVQTRAAVGIMGTRGGLANG